MPGTVPTPRPQPPTNPTTSTDHPAWCDRSRCEASLGRCHTTRPATLRARSGARLAVRLYALDINFPLIELITGDHHDGHRCRVDLTPADLRRLYRHIADTLDTLNPPEPPSPDSWPINGRRARP